MTKTPRKTARIVASYTASCFCDRPTLAKGETFAVEPRFYFWREANAYAAKHGLFALVLNGSEKSALGTVIAPCSHREAQSVRLSWDFV